MKQKKAKKTTKKVAIKKRKMKSNKPMKKRTVKKSTANRKKKVSAIPAGYHSITPYLIISNAAQAIEFYKKVFGAKEKSRHEMPGGKIGHAELKIGDALIMLADEHPEMDARAPQAFGGTPVSIHFYTKNVDQIAQRAQDAGAKLLRPLDNMFWGDRSCTLEDPYGHKWHVSTCIEHVTPAQIKKRAAEMYSKKTEI